jgi:hypothetical protein
VSSPRRAPERLIVMLLLVVAGFGLWLAHARAWNLGQRSPVLSYDSAQYALAARELAEHGRIATTFALPIELAKHPSPPWPLSLVQPGLVLWEALVFKVAPPVIRLGDRPFFYLSEPHQREWLTLLLPFGCYLMLAALLALCVARVLERHGGSVSAPMRAAAGLTIGLAFLLDPEAQHFAVGGMPELPYTLGLGFALAGLATGRAHRHPLLFGLILGVTGCFRANMLWLGPLLALGAAAIAAGRTSPTSRGGPLRRALPILALTMVGFLLPLAPWWIYKWRAFGSPGWDLERLILWEGIDGRSWFSLYHLPEVPQVPSVASAWGVLLRKLFANLPELLLASSTGLRALMIGGLAVWLAGARPARPLLVTGGVLLVAWAMGLATTALGIPWLRYLFPLRVAMEAAGLLATLALIARIPETTAPASTRRGLQVSLCVLTLAWGAWQSRVGNREAEAFSHERGVPSVLTLRDVGHQLRRAVPVGEPVMSNLGPMLSWYSRRPVVHLALTPLDVEACRERLEFRHVLLAFRGPERAWRGWNEVLADPERATARPEWNVSRVRVLRELDGFTIVWLELGPPNTKLASH